jgi:uncharacterized protein
LTRTVRLGSPGGIGVTLLAVAKTTLLVVDADGHVVADSCSVAATFASRLRGLLGTRDLIAGEGLVIRPASSIHTFFMRFPIDVVFLDRAGTVVKVVANLRAWRVAFARRGRDALELRAGEAQRHAIRPGSRLSFHAAGADA